MPITGPGRKHGILYTRALLFCFCLIFTSVASAQIPDEDATRINEFYRLASQIQDRLWAGWSHVPSPVLLVTHDTEFLTHYPDPPEGFHPQSDGFATRPRTFSVALESTFPAFGPIAVIVIGEPHNTASKTTTPWEIVLMHEHFHQLQDAYPGYFEAVSALGLSGDQKNAMWMLNYPFPYSNPSIARSFGALRDQLLKTVETSDPAAFAAEAKTYIAMRAQFLAQLTPNDHKYLSFQLWQEGIARYTQILAAEAAADYQPTSAYTKLPDYQSFAVYAPTMRANTLQELRTIDISQARREAIYPFGAVEGLFLDRWNPHWKQLYFAHLLTTDELFQLNTQ